MIAHEDAVSADTYAWARGAGFRERAPNTLVLVKIRDREATLELFKLAYPPRYLRQEIEPFLARLPLRLELGWPETALLLDALRVTSAFDYEVNPT